MSTQDTKPGAFDSILEFFHRQMAPAPEQPAAPAPLDERAMGGGRGALDALLEVAGHWADPGPDPSDPGAFDAYKASLAEQQRRNREPRSTATTYPVPAEPLPRVDDVPVPDPAAEGRAHTRMGAHVSESRGETYRQTAEFRADDEVPVREVDWSNHDRPWDHTLPHQHVYRPGRDGELKRGPQEPFLVPRATE